MNFALNYFWTWMSRANITDSKVGISKLVTAKSIYLRIKFCISKIAKWTLYVVISSFDLLLRKSKQH